MWSSAREVAAGDTVIVWLTRDQIQPLVVTPGKDFNTKFGNFRQSDFVGIPYGSKVVPKSGRGFIYLLRPTPELWTMALPHRTQILYLADIAFITSCLGIRKGSKVIEAGTGSASFSHSVARTIGPTGHLWSYEFHEARFNKAKEEFTSHGMDDRVTIHHRNVCKAGFTVVDQVDAVFLDLPAPWDAVHHAKQSLRKDCNSRICCFSPCIEQVLRTVNKLNEVGFTEITTYEALLRPIDAFPQPTLQPVSVVAEKLKASERKREEKRLRQIQANREKHVEQQLKEKERKRKRGEEEEEVIVNGVPHDGVDQNDDDNREAWEVIGANKKRARTEEDQEVRQEEEMEMDISSSITTTAKVTTVPLSAAEQGSDLSSLPVPTPATAANIPLFLPSSSESPDPATAIAKNPMSPAPTKINVSKALRDVRGHTSYLTFACLVPIFNPSSFSGEGLASSASDPETAQRTENSKSEPPSASE